MVRGRSRYFDILDLSYLSILAIAQTIVKG